MSRSLEELCYKGLKIAFKVPLYIVSIDEIARSLIAQLCMK